MTISNRPMPSIKQIQNNQKVVGNQKQKIQKGQSFNDIFQSTVKANETLKFSKHANLRLDKRNISLSNQQMERLNQGVQEARKKGINDSLMLMDNLALVVNVKNNVVVTALDQSETRNHVFTNIDGAVVL